MDDKLRLKLAENRRRVEEKYMKNRVPDILKQKAGGTAVDGDTCKPGNKRKAPAPDPSSAPASFLKYYFLFEFASGYALFDVHGMHKFRDEWGKRYRWTSFKLAEKYTNSNPFTLIAFYPFSSPADALIQMKAICNSTVTKELKGFIVNNLREPRSGYRLAISTTLLARNIFTATRKFVISGEDIQHVMRGLRVKTDKFIAGLEIGDLKMARLNLARGYRGQSCVRKESSTTVQRIFHSVFIDKVMVVPHKFEGLFIAKGLGKKNFMCTKNLVPGKVLCDDQLISVQNEDDKTEVEYRVWNPRLSKLAAAVLGGLTNIWIKPGSRVLYLGDVSGNMVLQLSDLVGSDGLVYVIGLSDVVANTVEERLNIIILPGNFSFLKDDTKFRKADNPVIYLDRDYHMVVGMVDVILGDNICSDSYLQMGYIANYARNHLKTGGHYLISTWAKNENLSSQVKDPFADDEFLATGNKMEFKTNELVMLESLGRGHAMAVGGYRM